MSNYPNPETLLIRRQEDEAARKRRPPLQHWPSSPRALAPRMRVQPPPLLSLGGEKPAPLSLPGTLTASKLKVTAILNAAELLTITAPEGKQRVTLRVRLPDRTITAEVSAKSLRKAQNAIREAGAAAIVLTLQGYLVASDVIAEAGLSVQPKTVKPPSPQPDTPADRRQQPEPMQEQRP
jgi:hypothetical protein